MCKIKVDSFVILKNPIDEVSINSIGLIQGLNSESAMVYFIGQNKIVHTHLQDIKTLILRKQAKGLILRYVIYAIY